MRGYPSLWCGSGIAKRIAIVGGAATGMGAAYNLIRSAQSFALRGHSDACRRCNEWLITEARRLMTNTLLDLGCGDGAMSFAISGGRRDVALCGVEASPALAAAAQLGGISVIAADLNGRLPIRDGEFPLIVASQVIEHLHNTRMFLRELWRILKPGGVALVTSENLTSLLNLPAMAMGWTPFSLIRVCGSYLGNPAGLHSGEHISSDVPIDSPAYSGATGHVRVLSASQAAELCAEEGFDVTIRSFGLMPLPNFIGRWLEGIAWRRGHLLCMRLEKPL